MLRIQKFEKKLYYSCVKIFKEQHQNLPTKAFKLLYMTLVQVLGDTCSYLLGELLGEYHKIESIKTLNIYVTPDDGLIRRNIYIECFVII